MMRLLRTQPVAVLGTLVFLAVSTLVTSMVAGTLARGTSGETIEIDAVFSDVAALRVGDDVRVAGVRVGRVTETRLEGASARVSMKVAADQRLDTATRASVAYLNLMGQRYVALEPGEGSEDATRPDALVEGDTIPLERTRAALDLTAMFNAFRPLFDALEPDQVNEFAENIVQTLQGQGPTLRGLVTQTADLTATLHDRDEVIGRVLDNLAVVLETTDQHGDQIRTLVSELGSLTGELADDRKALVASMDRIEELTGATAGLVEGITEPLTADIGKLRHWSEYVAAQEDLVGRAAVALPKQLNVYARSLGYGSFLNVYVCTLQLQLPGLPSVPLGSGRFSERCR